MTQTVGKIAADKRVRLLYSCETGSRAWGFPSPDSDYDVRFIYMHERDWYLSLSQKKDTIEQMNGELDITGWDLKKSLVLLKKSNAALIERFQSPITYFAAGDFKQSFSALIKKYYSPTAVFFHHYSLAQRFWEELKDQKEIKLKNYFYLIRSLLSCYWITEDNSVLPMAIEGLMAKIDTDRRDELRALVQLKATVEEKYLHPADKGLNNWIAELFTMLETAKHNLSVNREDSKALNNYFLQMVNDYADDRGSKA
ncbi:MAG: nucleotidyltransferase domain-containing protein [Chitinophagaceae bacterium]|nr:nucleotidyltransferase domain-containing protein [Chitinophagaceae bacterium]